MDPVILYSILLVGGLLLLLSTKLPIAISFALLGTAITLIIRGSSACSQLGVIAWTTATSDVIITIPLFVLMGELLFSGGLGSDLFETTSKWLGHLPAGLGVASVGSCMIFGAVCGSSVVTAATIGSVAHKEMTKRGYNESFSAGLLSVGGGIGLLIPPSIPFIVYAAITEQSVGKMFMAGVFPGILLSLCIAVYAIGYAIVRPQDVPLSESASWVDRFASLRRLVAVLTLVVIVLVSLYMGICTPGEAGAVGSFSAFLIVWLHKHTPLRVIWEAVIKSIQTSSMIFLILVGANMMNYAIAWTGIPSFLMETLVVSGNVPSWAFIPILCFAFLMMGMFMESLAVMLLILPTLLPALGALHIDLIWLGVIMVVNIEIAMLTPPVGLNCYVISRVTGLSLGKVIKGVWPFIAVNTGVLILMLLFPDIATWLPNRMG